MNLTKRLYAQRFSLLFGLIGLMSFGFGCTAPQQKVSQVPISTSEISTVSPDKWKLTQNISVSSAKGIIYASSTDFAWSFVIPAGFVLKSDQPGCELRQVKRDDGLEGVDVCLYNNPKQSEGPPPLDVQLYKVSTTSTVRDFYNDRIKALGDEGFVKTHKVAGVTYISFPDQCESGCTTLAALKEGFVIEGELYNLTDELPFQQILQNFHRK